MSYDPIAYWTAAGRDRRHIDHEANFKHTETFLQQERDLMDVLEGLRAFDSVLEFGCGWGRITELVSERWPNVPYTAVDLSPERLESARSRIYGVGFVESTIEDYAGPSADLVLAVETLMHIRPDDIKAVIEKMLTHAKKYVVTVDWTADLGDRPIASWNFRHDYGKLFGSRLVETRTTGLQSIHVLAKRRPSTT